MSAPVPARAWIVTFAGTVVNLCLGILYAWSVWKKELIATADHSAGSPMSGINEGWHYLTDAEGTPLDGGDKGVPGDNGTFVIAPNGTRISR